MKILSMNKAIVLGVALLLFVGARTTHAQSVTVTLSNEKQVIRGFGGMNCPLWVGDLTAAQRTTAFGNGTGQIGMSVMRMIIDKDKSNWSKEVATAKRAIELGAIVFATPWNPPDSMCDSSGVDSKGNPKKHLKPSSYGSYVTFLNDFYTYMKNNGVTLYAESIQNEPDYAYTWTWMSPTEIHNFMVNNAGSLIAPRVITPESFSYDKTYYDQLLNDPKALANFEIVGAHTYGTPYGNFPYPLFTQKGAGKDLWMTEVYYPNSDANSADLWPSSLDVATHIHYAMTQGNFQAYVWWYIRRQYSPMKEDGTMSKRGDCMAHFSKFVRPGAIRVNADTLPTAGVHVSAYKNGSDVILVVVNTNTSAKTLNVSIPGTSINSLTKYTTSATKSVGNDGTVAATNGTFSASFDAQSVTTLVYTAPAGSSSSSKIVSSSSVAVSSVAVSSVAVSSVAASSSSKQSSSSAAISSSSSVSIIIINVSSANVTTSYSSNSNPVMILEESGLDFTSEIGACNIYSLTGKMLGSVNLSSGTNMREQVGRFVKQTGIYLVKSQDGRRIYRVAVMEKNSQR